MWKKNNNVKIITKVNNKLNLKFTATPIPIVINAKNITSSKGLFTGVLNLTIDNAPIIPNDKAILLDINVVIIEVIDGNNR